MCATWAFAVPGVMPAASAMKALVWPWARSTNTSCSRGERPYVLVSPSKSLSSRSPASWATRPRKVSS